MRAVLTDVSSPLLWRYESRRVGVAAQAAPAAALAVTLLLTAFTANAGGSRADIERLLLTGLEAVVPLAVAVATVTVITRDRCRELHLALPVRYVTTLGRRLATLVGAAAATAVIYSAALVATGWWSGPAAPASPLVWVPPLLALGGLAMILTVVGRSVVLASSGVAATWLAQQLYAASLASHAGSRPFFLFLTSRYGTGEGWLLNRFALTVTGLCLLAVAVTALSRPGAAPGEEEQ